MYSDAMDKIIQRTVTITILETWTITWANGEASTVFYGSRQSFPLLPACPTHPQDGNDLEPSTTDSSEDSAITQMEASEPPCVSTDGIG
jgi:hypothetical protein